jgi:hypothetical protein
VFGVFQVEQGPFVRICFQDNGTPAPPVAAVGATFWYACGAVKVYTACSALTGSEHNFYVVNKILLCHLLKLGGKGSQFCAVL